MEKEHRKIHILISDSFNRFSPTSKKPAQNYKNIQSVLTQLGFPSQYVAKNLSYLLFNCQGNQYSTTSITPQHTTRGAVYAGLESEALHDFENSLPDFLKNEENSPILTYYDASKQVRKICELFTNSWKVIEVKSET